MPTSDHESKAIGDFSGLKLRSLDGAAATAGSQGIKIALQFISQVWLARLISPAEYGLVAMVTPILGFISMISDMGIGTAIVQQSIITQSQLSTLFWINAAASSVISLGLIAASPLVGWFYHEPKTIDITIAMALLFFLGAMTVHPSAILTRELRLVTRAVIDCTAVFVGLVVGILFARAGWGYWSLIYLQAAGTLVSLLLTWWTAHWLPSWPGWDRSAGQIMRFGTSITVSNIATYFTMSADNMIVGAVSGKVALGFYDKAYRLVTVPLLQLSTPVGRVAVPLLSRLRGEPAQYASVFRRMIQLPTLLFTPALICGMFLAPQIVRILLGPTWAAISPVFSWICFGATASSVYGSASWLLTSQGQGRTLMKWSVITSLISISSFAIGIRWGAVGVACFASVGFVFIQTPLMIRAATRIGPVKARSVVGALTPIAVSFAVTAPAIYLFSKLVRIGDISKLAVGIPLAIVVYLIPLALLSAGRDLLGETFALLSSYGKRLWAGRLSAAANTSL